MGWVAMDGYIQLQGTGDLGEEVVGDDGRPLYRSTEPVERTIRSVFGKHSFDAYVYSRGRKMKVEMRPIDARMELPEAQQSYLYQEFSQLFCVEQAFGQACHAFATIFKQKASVDTFERINQRMGEQAEAFLDSLPTPPADEEGALLIMTADGKGIPLVQEDVQKLSVIEDKPERPGNRKIATLASVYTVDPFVRDPEQILEALFKDYSDQKPPKRPEPQFKHVVGKLPTPEREIPSSSATLAVGWAAEQVSQRRHENQKVIVLLDGQVSLANACDDCLWEIAQVPDDEIVHILDLLHVAQYVWRAAKALEAAKEHQEAFAHSRLKRILEGDAQGVVRGMRWMATARNLTDKNLEEINTVVGYLENNLDRMRYDQYLAAGYPIATGVIEGACRHLVKDRFERSGMRWSLEGARAMLHVRAVHASSYWDEFHEHRKTQETEDLYPYRETIIREPVSLKC
jgi:hypothetical protein